jgi:FKBP-type peptidyl-prolyl cis-trans isomerase (trigger factor)
MTGHLEAYQDPGHFVGKGWLQLQFDRIGTAEKIEATDEDIEREIAALAERSGESATALRARGSRLTIQRALDRMRPKLRSDKAIEWLYRTAWIETPAEDDK